MTYFLLESNKTTSKEKYTQIACIVAFCVFSFVYLYFYQQDVLAAAQHVLSGGKTHYDRTVGAVLITLTGNITKVIDRESRGRVGAHVQLLYAEVDAVCPCLYCSRQRLT